MIRIFKEKKSDINAFLKEAKELYEDVIEEYPEIHRIKIDLYIFCFSNLRTDISENEEDLDLEKTLDPSIVFYNSEFVVFDPETNGFDVFMDEELLEKNYRLALQYFVHSLFDVFTMNIDSGLLARKDVIDECIFEGFSEYNAWKFIERKYGKKEASHLYLLDDSPTKRYFLLYRSISPKVSPFDLVVSLLNGKEQFYSFIKSRGIEADIFNFCYGSDSFPDISEKSLSTYVKEIIKDKIKFVTKLDAGGGI